MQSLSAIASLILRSLLQAILKLLGWVWRGILPGIVWWVRAMAKITFLSLSFFVLFAILIASLASFNVEDTAELPEEPFVLTLSMAELRGRGDSDNIDFFALLRDEFRTLSYRDRWITLAELAEEENLIGIKIVYDGWFAPVDTQALAGALRPFVDADKPVWVVAEDLGYYASGFSGLASYVPATVGSEVWLAEYGGVSQTGMQGQHVLAGNLFEKLGLGPILHARREYKAGGGAIFKQELPAVVRQNEQQLLDDLHAAMFSLGTSLRKAHAGAAPPNAPEVLLLPFAAKNAGWIDRVGTEQELDKHIADTYAKPVYHDFAEILLRQAIDEDRPWNAEKESAHHEDDRDSEDAHNAEEDAAPAKDPAALETASIKVIDLEGTILGSQPDGFGNTESAITPDLVTRLLEDAKFDDGLLITINSPGGDAFASEKIYRALQDWKAEQPHRTISVVFRDVAASGGYYIAMAADSIHAYPATITGSIGVYATYLTLLNDPDSTIGSRISLDSIETGELAGIFSPIPPDAARLAAEGVVIDRIYDRFVELVRQGRNFTPVQVDAVARGRIFSGNRAHRVGLLDGVDGLQGGEAHLSRHFPNAELVYTNAWALPSFLTPFEEFISARGAKIIDDAYGRSALASLLTHFPTPAGVGNDPVQFLAEHWQRNPIQLLYVPNIEGAAF